MKIRMQRCEPCRGSGQSAGAYAVDKSGSFLGGKRQRCPVCRGKGKVPVREGER